jgi:di/tricarboxylate transporter
MSAEQWTIIGILVATVVLFLWGPWRHDMVAVGALLACVLAGLVPPVDAFDGFGHPAVITVACVLVLSRGLLSSGAIDLAARSLLPARAGPVLTIVALTVLGAVMSGFMNNVGALALLMPVAIRVASRLDLPPGRILMPLSFGTILGGMTTLIGTPPNLIVSAFRAESGATSFGMFDYAPVGAAVAAAGVAFITLFGWRLVPARKEAAAEGFDTGDYLTEVRVKENGRAEGQQLRDVELALEEIGGQVVGLVRNGVRLIAPNPGRTVRAGDILIIEAEARALTNAMSQLGLSLEEARRESEESSASESVPPPMTEDEGSPADEATGDEASERGRPSGEVVLMELAVLPGAAITGRSASEIMLRRRYGINLLALSRQGRRSVARLRAFAVQPGDLLLMQGAPEAIAEFAAEAGCVPLAERELRMPNRRQAITAVAIMTAAIAGAAFGLLPAAITFAAGVLASMAFRTVPPRTAYGAVDWTVIVLLGAMIPVAGVMETTGTARLIATGLIDHLAQGNAVIALAAIMVVSMTLSDLVNNAATAAIMCPIAIGTAAALSANPDAFLMAVAIGSSCAFLTPIGHQNNTLILGPGGFRFGDYWRLGLPLEILVTAISIPLLLIVWPL